MTLADTRAHILIKGTAGGREKIFRMYCRGSDWYNKTSPEAKANADSVSEQAIAEGVDILAGVIAGL